MNLRSIRARGVLALATALATASCNAVLRLGDFEDAPASTGQGGATGGTGGSGGEGDVCAPGDVLDCAYTGLPASTQDVGACKAGTRTCLPDGTGYGGCAGEVTPKAEDCGTAEDDSCDGQANESCLCEAGDTMACYSGPVGTAGVGACQSGSQMCKEDGLGYGACVGETLPESETCASPNDEDCSGHDCARWAKVFGDSGYQEGTAISADPSGNIFVSGHFDGGLALGVPGLSSAGALDIFVGKLDGSGNHLWSKQFGDANQQYTTAMAVDSAGDVIIAGYFGGTIDFGGGALSSTGDLDIFIAKLASDGSHIWSRSFGNPSQNQLDDLAVDPSGNVFATGSFSGAVDFGTGAVTSAGLDDFFLFKLTAGTGSTQWVKTAGDASNQSGQAVGCDAQGNVAVAGTFQGTMTTNLGNLTASGVSNVFLLRYDGAGNLSWFKNFIGDGAAYASSLAVDPITNEVIIAGPFSTSITLGAASLATAGGDDIFLGKFTSGGNHVWSKSFGSSSHSESAVDIAVDDAGAILMAGATPTAIDFGGGPIVSPGGYPGVYLVKFTEMGAHAWSRRSDASIGFIASKAVATAPAGDVLLAVMPDGTLDLGTGSLASAGDYDVAIARFAP